MAVAAPAELEASNEEQTLVEVMPAFVAASVIAVGAAPVPGPDAAC